MNNIAHCIDYIVHFFPVPVKRMGGRVPFLPVPAKRIGATVHPYIS